MRWAWLRSNGTSTHGICESLWATTTDPRAQKHCGGAGTAPCLTCRSRPTVTRGRRCWQQPDAVDGRNKMSLTVNNSSIEKTAQQEWDLCATSFYQSHSWLSLEASDPDAQSTLLTAVDGDRQDVDLDRHRGRGRQLVLVVRAEDRLRAHDDYLRVLDDLTRRPDPVSYTHLRAHETV